MSDIDALWDFGDPVASEVKFREALASADGVQALEIRTQLARALGLQGRFEEGYAELDGIPGDGGGCLNARIHLERGRLFNSAGNAVDAVAEFLNALGAAGRAGEIGLEIDAIHMLAIADGENAERWSTEGLELARARDAVEAKRWIGPLLNNLGWTLFDAGRPGEALDRFRESEVVYAEAGKSGAVAIARWSEARCMREMGLHDEALAIQLDLAATNSEPDPYVFEELVAIYTAAGDPESAAKWQVKSDVASGQSMT